MKFKQGTQVKCINKKNYLRLKKGKYYTVDHERVREGVKKIVIQLDNFSFVYDKDCFELAEPTNAELRKEASDKWAGFFLTTLCDKYVKCSKCPMWQEIDDEEICYIKSANGAMQEYLDARFPDDDKFEIEVESGSIYRSKWNMENKSKYEVKIDGSRIKIGCEDFSKHTFVQWLELNLSLKAERLYDKDYYITKETAEKLLEYLEGAKP